MIDSSFAFDAYVRLDHHGPFDAGDYHLQKHLGIQAAVDVLEKGPVITYITLRIPPGLWLTEVAKQVQKQMPGLSAAKFVALAQSDAVRSKYEPAGMHSLEGLLFPDTYRFTKKDREIDVIRTLVKRFDSVATAAGLDRVHVAGLTPYQVVVVASMVQEESGTDHDRPLIASVIDNRLKIHMPLQIDATVLYALQIRKASNTAATARTRRRTTPTCTRACRRRRSARSPRSRWWRHCIRRRRPTSTSSWPVPTGTARSRRRSRSTTRTSRRRAGWACCSERLRLHAPDRDHRRSGAALALAGDAQRRVRGHRPRLALRRAARRARCRRARARRDPRARHRGLERHDAAQGRRRGDACDEVRGDAARLHSVNCVSRGAGGTLVGESTDGEGFVRRCGRRVTIPPASPRSCSAPGGAARAVVLALAQAGAQVRVAARRPEAAADVAGLAAGVDGGVGTVAWSEVGAAARSCDLVVNATPIGMGAAGSAPAGAALPLQAGDLGPDRVVADLVYQPRRTALLELAAASGAATVDGVGMLVHQGAIAFERWTGTAGTGRRHAGRRARRPRSSLRRLGASCRRPSPAPRPGPVNCLNRGFVACR